MYTPATNRFSPEYVLLGFLYLHPSHGYDLHKRMSAEFGYIWHASQSQTYAILKRLEAKGYIAATSVEQEKLPPKQMLRITVTGKERFETWLQVSSKCSVHAIRVEFITRFYFVKLYFPERAQMMVEAQQEVIAAGINQLELKYQYLSARQPFNKLALELRIKLLYSVSEWLIECAGSARSRFSLEGENE